MKYEKEAKKTTAVKVKKTSQFVLCIKNEDCEDLELRKIYRVLPDKEAAEDGYIRVIDESGEDYLYPQDYFVPVELSRAAEEALLAAMSATKNWPRY